MTHLTFSYSTRSGALRRSSHSKSGFSLAEIMVAVVIMGILAGVVMMNLGGASTDARIATTKANLKTIKTAVLTYKTKFGQAPTTEQGLQALIQAPTVPPIPNNYPVEGFLDTRSVPLDAWGNPFQYITQGDRGMSEIISYGADGEPGGEGPNADISSLDP